jgi:hypothetical protein
MRPQQNEKIPREPWPEPQPSRDSRPSGVGPGTQLRMEFLPMAEAAGRCAIRRSRPPRLRKDLASRETRRSVTARRSQRIPVRSSDRPWLPRFPGGSRFPHHGLGAALTSPNLLIRAAAGFPLRRGWKRRPALRWWQLQALILFRELIESFRGGVSGRGKAPLSGSFQADSAGPDPIYVEVFPMYGDVVVVPAEGDQIVGIGPAPS